MYNFMAACDTVSLQVQYSQRNIPANKSRKYVRSVAIPEAYAGGDLLQTLPTELADHAMQSWSPSGTALPALCTDRCKVMGKWKKRLWPMSGAWSCQPDLALPSGCSTPS